MKHEDVEEMLEDCFNREDKLSEWDENFLSDISLTYGRLGKLSDKQYDQLVKIWEKVT